MDYLSLTNIIIAIVVVFVLWVVLTYNNLIRLRYRVREAWADIDVQLKRRYDLIPNLIETVKGYAAHEKTVFENVTKARTAAMAAEQSGDRKKIAETENFLTGALKTLFAVAENYPTLRASENFLELQREISDTENKIQASRRFYNGNVMEYNTKIETIPTNLIAKTLSFKREEFFELESEIEKGSVRVDF